jgi:outer membrane protein
MVVLFFMPFSVWADEHFDAANFSQAQFQFKHQRFAVGNQVGRQSDLDLGLDNRASQQVFTSKGSGVSGNFDQYDATISYPFSPRELINFDLGINIRFIEASLMEGSSEPGMHNLNTTLPMLYANAIFGRPYAGLSASLDASHIEYEQYYAFDYKAKLSYQWQNGFGMEGGWQHQALSIDGSQFQTDIENKGLFLDLKYRF